MTGNTFPPVAVTNLPVMKNGTSSAILVRELFTGDGPHVLVAEDFVADRCTFCGQSAADGARFSEAGFVCDLCASASED